MVKLKVLQFSFVVFIVSLSTLCFASPQLILLTDKKETEIGRPIRVEIVAVSLENKLSKIDLTSINNHFGIVTDYATDETQDARWPGETIQTLNLKLYPRQTGNLVIPVLKLGKYISKEKRIQINSGKFGKPQITISSNSPYTREQFTLHVTLFANELSTRLSVNNDENIPSFDNIPLKFKREKQSDGRYRLQTGWVLSALNNGMQNLQLPAIELSVSGVSRRKYYFPVQQINVKKLPSYLPPTIPVGKIDIQSKLSKSGLLKTDSVIYWQLQLKGKLINSYQLPPVLRQIKSNNRVKYFPATSKRMQDITERNLISSVTHSIPLKLLKSGFTELPKIKTQYFDPESGKIVNVSRTTTTKFSLNLYLQTLILLILLLAAGYLFKVLFKIWKLYHYSRQQRNLAIQLLQNSVMFSDIRDALKLISRSECWPNNLSLTQWQENWSKKYATDLTFRQLFNEISLACYSNEDFNKENLANIARKLVCVFEDRKSHKTNVKFNLPAFNL